MKLQKGYMGYIDRSHANYFQNNITSPSDTLIKTYNK